MDRQVQGPVRWHQAALGRPDGCRLRTDQGADKRLTRRGLAHLYSGVAAGDHHRTRLPDRGAREDVGLDAGGACTLPVITAATRSSLVDHGRYRPATATSGPPWQQSETTSWRSPHPGARGRAVRLCPVPAEAPATPRPPVLIRARAPGDYPEEAKKRPADYTGRRVPVFPALHQVTCGRAVNMPVDNDRRVRITAFFLWIPCG